jgi:hypothetical protein
LPSGSPTKATSETPSGAILGSKIGVAPAATTESYVCRMSGTRMANWNHPWTLVDSIG